MGGLGDRLFGDKLVLRGLLFHGYHGVYKEEQVLGQKFKLDIDAYTDLSKAGSEDDLKHSISYATLYKIAKDIVEGPACQLVEAVANKIATQILSDFPQIKAIRVQIGKPQVAVVGVVDYLGVEIVRFKSDIASS